MVADGEDVFRGGERLQPHFAHHVVGREDGNLPVQRRRADGTAEFQTADHRCGVARRAQNGYFFECGEFHHGGFYRAVAGDDEKFDRALKDAEMNLRPVAHDDCGLVVHRRVQVTVEEICAHGGDKDVECVQLVVRVRFSGQRFRVEHGADHADGGRDGASREALSFLRTDIQQVGEQGERTECSLVLSIRADDRHCGNAGVFELADRVEQRKVGCYMREIRFHNVTDAQIDVVSALRGLELEVVKDPCRAVGQNARADRRDVFLAERMFQRGESISRHDAVHIRVSVPGYEDRTVIVLDRRKFHRSVTRGGGTRR